MTRDYKYIRPPKDDIYLVFLKSRTRVVLYEFCTLSAVLPSYESAKLTNLTASSRSFMSHWFSSTPLAMSIPTPPPPLNHVAISKREDENQCDSEILKMAVRFVSLATPFVIPGRRDKCRPLVVYIFIVCSRPAFL